LADSSKQFGCHNIFNATTIFQCTRSIIQKRTADFARAWFRRLNMPVVLIRHVTILPGFYGEDCEVISRGMVDELIWLRKMIKITLGVEAHVGSL
jgi:hypothetical protein